MVPFCAGCTIAGSRVTASDLLPNKSGFEMAGSWLQYQSTCASKLWQLNDINFFIISRKQ